MLATAEREMYRREKEHQGALQEHQQATQASMAEALHGLGGLSQLVVAGAGLLVAYAAAVVAAAEPKAKRG